VGHALECRINAEDAWASFVPSPGEITRWQVPEGEGVRVDTHCFRGYEVPPYYDSMIGKLITHGVDRNAAIDRMLDAIDRFLIDGIRTTLPFARAIVDDADFRSARITTTWLENVFLPRALQQTGARP
jgi:acetyl-CoA carboxylase biotin carboxylase subunit